MANFSYDKAAGRYRAPNGRFLPEREVRGVVDTVIGESGRRMRDLAGRVRSGDVSLPEFRALAMREIKLGHMVAATAARGGWAGMDAQAWGLVGSQLKAQYKYLDGMVADVASGKQPLNGRFEARAASYAQASRQAYEERRRRDGQEQRGTILERRLRHARESCPDCVDLAARGWQPAGTLPTPGTGTRCLVNCLCTMQQRTARDLMEAA